MIDKILETLTAIRDQNAELLRLNSAIAADIAAIKDEQERLGVAIAADLRNIETGIDDLNTLADRRKKHRDIVARSRKKNADVTSQNRVTSQKENESGKENIPPTPPIRVKGKEKESSSSSRRPKATLGARAHACTYACKRTHVCVCAAGLVEYDALPEVIDVREMPCLGMLVAFAHQRVHFYDDEFIHAFYQAVAVEGFWVDSKSGEPIRHWPAYFRAWRDNRKFHDLLRDPDRLPDARIPR